MVRYVLFLVFLLIFSLEGHGATLDDVRTRGVVNCGVDEQHYGFAYIDENGQWDGFEVDFCRALAAAIFDDGNRVAFVPLNAQTRFGALQNKKVDVLIRSSTWTYTRDATYGVDFPNVTFYDHLAILAHKSIGVDSLDEVTDGTICVAEATTTYDSVREYVENARKNIKIQLFNTRGGLSNFFFSGQCDLYAGDHSALQSILMGVVPNPDQYVFLKTSLSKEPLGPVVREGDREWFEIVKWLVYGMIEAEERGISKSNLERMKASKESAVQFMLGVKPGFGQPMRLKDGWLASIIASVGNYGDVFDRHLGMASPFKMERGLNALWEDGGLMYGMPIR